MKKLEQKIRRKIEEILSQQCGAVKRTQIMAQLEGLSIIHAIIGMVTEIEKEKQDQIEQLQEEIRKLHARLNQMSLVNDHNRDRQIIELHKQGLSKEKIAASVGMTRQGVYKALARLDVNSVASR